MSNMIEPINVHSSNVNEDNFQSSKDGNEEAWIWACAKYLLVRLRRRRIGHSVMTLCGEEREFWIFLEIWYLFLKKCPPERNLKTEGKWSVMEENREISIEIHLMAHLCHVSVERAWRMVLFSRTILQHSSSDGVSENTSFKLTGPWHTIFGRTLLGHVVSWFCYWRWVLVWCVSEDKRKTHVYTLTLYFGFEVLTTEPCEWDRKYENW